MKLLPIAAGVIAAFLMLVDSHIQNAGALACGVTQGQADRIAQRYAQGEPPVSPLGNQTHVSNTVSEH